MISLLYLWIVVDSCVVWSIRNKCINSDGIVKRCTYSISLFLLYVIIPFGIGFVTSLLVKLFIPSWGIDYGWLLSVIGFILIVECIMSIIFTLIGFVMFLITLFKSMVRHT